MKVVVVEGDNNLSRDDHEHWLVGLAASRDAAQKLISTGDCQFHPYLERGDYEPSTPVPIVRKGGVIREWKWRNSRWKSHVIIFTIYEEAIYEGEIQSGT